MKIIAVDDKKLTLEALTDAIKKTEPNAQLYCFRSGSEALAFEEIADCDVAFLDIEMPEVNGITLAKKLKIINPYINIIFATGYGEYTGEAIELHCSGYLMKPITPEKVRRELDDLRHPVQPQRKKRVRIQTFGNFEIYVDGEPLRFQRDKTKELLAYLVDRGTLCTHREIIAALWENDVSDSYFRHLYKDLSDTLREKGCEDILIRQRGKLGIAADNVECDYYDWIEGKPRAINAYRGEYMSQYSWSEFIHGTLR